VDESLPEDLGDDLIVFSCSFLPLDADKFPQEGYEMLLEVMEDGFLSPWFDSLGSKIFLGSVIFLYGFSRDVSS